MKIVKIPKSNGSFREVACPPISIKKKQRELLRLKLNKIQYEKLDLRVNHGFVPTRSIVTNALMHVGFRFTLNFDLKNFFDNVKREMVEKYLTDSLTKEEIDLCFYNGRAYQGFSTSPAIANLAAIELDNAIKDILSKYHHPVVYTRYADDLTFSFTFHWTYEWLLDLIPKLVEQNGFCINKAKTSLQDAFYGRRDVTGVRVSYHNIHISKNFKKKLNKYNKLSQNGKKFIRSRKVFALISRNKMRGIKDACVALNEFAKLKPPTKYIIEQQLNNFEALVLNFKINQLLKDPKAYDAQYKGYVQTALYNIKKFKESIVTISKAEIITLWQFIKMFENSTSNLKNVSQIISEKKLANKEKIPSLEHESEIPSPESDIPNFYFL